MTETIQNFDRFDRFDRLDRIYRLDRLPQFKRLVIVRAADLKMQSMTTLRLLVVEMKKAIDGLRASKNYIITFSPSPFLLSLVFPSSALITYMPSFSVWEEQRLERRNTCY